jgi:hypothetical protein
MSILFNESMECAIGCCQSHFAADVTVKFRKPPFMNIRPEDVDIISVNGFVNPWQYHKQVALDCEYLLYNFIELIDAHEKHRIPELFEQVYSQLPLIPDAFYFKDFAIPGQPPSAFNTRCMFHFIEWRDETMDTEDDEDLPGMEDMEPDELENEQSEDTGLMLPAAVMDKINAALWPYAQVVMQSMAMLYRNLRIMAMGRLKKHPPAIHINNSLIPQSAIPPYYMTIDGPVEAPPHTIAILFPSKN